MTTPLPILSFTKILPGLRAVFNPTKEDKDMAMATTPVTQAQWKAIVDRFPDCGLNPEPSHFSDNPENPVECISYNEITQWLTLLNQVLEKEGSEYRACLPTEDIWEEFAKAGRNPEYPTGDTISPKLANYGDNYGSTTPVMSFPSNPWGLYDIAGNVFEFVADNLPDFTKTLDLEASIKNLQGQLEDLKKKLSEAGRS